MAVTKPSPHKPIAPHTFLGKTRMILEMIKFEHTIFAMPFALISAILASRRAPHGLQAATLGWIVVAMIGARSAAMAFNRLADASFDADNPRTARRHLPAGLITRAQVTAFLCASIALFELSAWRINPLCFALSPLALLAVLGYSYTKRFTALCHIVLGIAIGLAPIGAWLAVLGRFDVQPVLLGLTVMLWIGGFDIIYALQDYEYDRSSPLHSLPKALGKSKSLAVSRLMHMAAVGLLLTIGRISGLHALYYIGVAVVAALIVYEQSLVKPDDLRRVDLAFFTLNGWVSVSLFAFVLLDRLVSH